MRSEAMDRICKVAAILVLGLSAIRCKSTQSAPLAVGAENIDQGAGAEKPGEPERGECTCDTVVTGSPKKPCGEKDSPDAGGATMRQFSSLTVKECAAKEDQVVDGFIE